MSKITKRRYPIHSETKVISARVPLSILNKVDHICSVTGRSRSDVISQIIEEYIFFETVE